jgi:hypothetical protein
MTTPYLKTDYREILIARNRTKKRYQDFRYEAMQNMMQSFCGSASEFSFAVCAMALKAMKKKMDFLTDDDNKIINDLRIRITHNR